MGGSRALPLSSLLAAATKSPLLHHRPLPLRLAASMSSSSPSPSPAAPASASAIDFLTLCYRLKVTPTPTRATSALYASSVCAAVGIGP